MIHEREREFRQQRFARICALMEHHPAGTSPDRSRYLATLRAQIEEFLSIHDADTLRDDLAALNADPDFVAAFPGFRFGIHTFLEQLSEAAPDPEDLRRVLVTVLDAPLPGQAQRRIDQLVHFVDRVRTGSKPDRRSAMTFLSFCWWVQSPQTWPFLWSTSEEGLKSLGWLPTELAPGELYSRYVEAVTSLAGDDDVIEQALAWAAEHVFAPDTSICARLEWAVQLDAFWAGGRYDPDVSSDAKANISAVLADLRQFGAEMVGAVSEQVGRILKRQLASDRPTRGIDRYRTDAWVKWRLAEPEGWNEAPSIMVRFHSAGAVIGFKPGRREQGWAATIRPLLEEVQPEGATLLGAGLSPLNAVLTSPRDGEYVIGYEIPVDKIEPETFPDEVIAAATALQPVFDRAMSLLDVPRALQRPDLVALREKYIREVGFPTEKYHREASKRAEFAALLQPEVLEDLTRESFRGVASSSHYGHTGNQAMLNQTLRDAEDGFEHKLSETLRYLLWSADPVEVRIDRCLEDDALRIRGLGETVVVKLLAVTHPERFIPVFPISGDNGKAVLMDALGIERPSASLTRGERQVVANDALREVLEPLFPRDPLGQAEFAYWVRDHLLEPETDPLDLVVEECYLPDRSFVDELVGLLEDKKQVVLYGPPGTGKTFIARKLAEALAPGPEHRRFVQFHPSTAYEDFFEGYRPTTDSAGALTYQLTLGPFAQLADHAAEDGRRHVLVIDELNRANVPKVFGELLFLLEYRDAEVTPLYRQEGFELPENVWVIATMNTADRSIATLDQALRRRFHFVPIFPDDGPMEGLLERFLAAHDGDTRWAALVNMVNGELRDRLGSGDQLVGPSHFLKEELDATAMERIWRYNIEPLMDDLFYGDQATIHFFKWPAVVDRFGETAEPSQRNAEPVDGSVSDGPDDLL